MDMWLKTGTLKRLASRTEIRSTDLVAMEILWISKMIIMKCKVRLIGLFRTDIHTFILAMTPRLDLRQKNSKHRNTGWPASFSDMNCLNNGQQCLSWKILK
ncbi:hypothetical protein AVEN_246838-1 [Araneus ventricosus]|uniref:Uncharacterized protein n=1 Tax=Araneus ventricosus TaxID=182803 RepID=A0A4Y2UXB8_ARAVE|nr:hypothetical protein AVEN_246838-1 [Araneus ventricosus]